MEFKIAGNRVLRGHASEFREHLLSSFEHDICGWCPFFLLLSLVMYYFVHRYLGDFFLVYLCISTCSFDLLFGMLALALCAARTDRYRALQPR